MSVLWITIHSLKCNMKVKIGQQIKFTKNHQVPTSKGKTLLVKAGDVARVLKKVDETTGEIVYLTGEAKGFSHKVPLQVDDSLDVDAIAKKILNDIQY